MRTPTLLPIPLFRSNNQAALLSALVLSDKSLSVQELSTKLNIPYPTIHREISRLLKFELVSEERVGNYRFFEPNRTSPFYPPLYDLLLVLSGPVPILKEELSQIPGIEWVALFGSWAHRLLGKTGNTPQDVDVLVVGDPDVRRVNRACTVVGKKLGWEVNPIILTHQEWVEDTPFLHQVRSEGLVPVFGYLEGGARDGSHTPHRHPTGKTK